MNASLYIIGTELTRGIITDKHTQVISSELAKLNYDVNRSVIVPDDGTIQKSLRVGVQDSDLLIVTGGLGPTSDDMTRSIIANLAGVELEKNQKAWDTLYKKVGERIHGANEQQAFIPHGFEIIENNHGTAPGFRGKFKYEGREIVIICMPGPPAEMQPMFYQNIIPYLAGLNGQKEPERDEYSVFLIAEAKLEELCKQVAIDGISWGTRFQAMRISLYISGDDAKKRKNFIDKLRKLAGPGLIVDGNVEAIDLLTDCLRKNRMTISCAESCTCGLLAKTLTDKAGSSAWFWGGAATYSLEAKRIMLGVSEDINDAVSDRCAAEMAQGMLKVSGSDVSISITGFAGPATESDTKPVGTVYLGFASRHRKTQVVGLRLFTSNRDGARRRFTVAALVLAYQYLNKKSLIDITTKWLYI